MDFTMLKEFISRIIAALKAPRTKRVNSILVTVGLVIAVFITINQLQRLQDLRQRASGPGNAPVPASIVAMSSNANATQSPSQTHFIRTTDGTFHLFVNVGTIPSTCAGNSTTGLVWFTSPDNASWTCQGQLSSDTGNMQASVTMDNSDNIYAVYSPATTGGGTSKNVYYRKLTKGSGASWTIGAAQTVLSGTAQVGYGYAVIEVDGDDTIWVASRKFDGTNYSVTVLNSDGLGESPNWTESVNSESTHTSTSLLYPTLVDFGNRIGVIYLHHPGFVAGNFTTFKWKFRYDNEPKNQWTPESIVTDIHETASPAFKAIGDENGRVSLAYVHDAPNSLVSIAHYNGRVWSVSNNATIGEPDDTGNQNYDVPGVSLSTDGTNVWAFYGEQSAFFLIGSRLSYKKGYAPFATSNFDTNGETMVSSYHTFFDKVWVEDADAPTRFEDKTEAAGPSADNVIHSTSGKSVKDIDDAIYVGKTTPFDQIGYSHSNPGDVGASDGEVVWEYWNGNSWTALPIITSSRSNFERHVLVNSTGDFVVFNQPSDWAATTVSNDSQGYYYVRVRTVKAYIPENPPEVGQIVPWSWRRGVAVLPNPVDNKIYATWTENSTGPYKIRSSYVEVETSPPPSQTAEISSVVSYSDQAEDNYYKATHKKLVKTSDGTLHAFHDAGKYPLACGAQGAGNNSGLVWITSTDEGNTWVCRQQLYYDTTNYSGLTKIDARVDKDDNIYLVYDAIVENEQNQQFWAIYYQKLTKGTGTNWSVETKQIALTGEAGGNTAYEEAVLELDNDRIWLAARYRNGSEGRLRIFYSDGFGSSPTWTLSEDPLDNPCSVHNNNKGNYYATFVRFGTKIGVIYSTETLFYWRVRDDSDPLTSWGAPELVGCGILTPNFDLGSFTAISDKNNNVYFASNSLTSVSFSFYNGSEWTPQVSWGSATHETTISIVTDGNDNAWVMYGDTRDLFDYENFCIGDCGNPNDFGQPMYRHLTWPYSDNGGYGTVTIPSHTFFDKVWVYDDSELIGKFEDKSIEAKSSTEFDVFHSSSQALIKDLNDAVYFGQSEKWDRIAWPDYSSTVGIDPNGQVMWEYWNGSEWRQQNDIFYSAVSAIQPADFRTRDVLSFTPHIDWQPTSISNETESFYYLRARVIKPYTVFAKGRQFIASDYTHGVEMLPEIENNQAKGIFYGAQMVRSWGWAPKTRHVFENVDVDPVEINQSTSPSRPLVPVIADSNPNNFEPPMRTQRNMVRTSNDVVHSFIQVNDKVVDCNGTDRTGLLWYISDNNGQTWTCKNQIAEPLENEFSNFPSFHTASAVVDSNDNIYLVYATANESELASDVLYRKLTKSGSDWTMGPEQTIFDPVDDRDYYAQPVIELDDNRLWVAVSRNNRSFGEKSIPVFYSSDFSSTTQWTESITSLSTPGWPEQFGVIVRFGSKIGVIYNDESDNLKLRYRDADDPLDTWSNETIAVDTESQSTRFSAVGDLNGNIHLVLNRFTNQDPYPFREIYHKFDGASWSEPVILHEDVNAPGDTINTISYDSDGFVWVFYNDTLGHDFSLEPRKWVYKKGMAPFGKDDFDENPTPINSSHGFFDKVWKAEGSSFTNVTNQAANTNEADIEIPSDKDDAMYFGKAEKFDSIKYAINPWGAETGFGGVIIWEYWNGSNWTALSTFVKGNGTNLHYTGQFTFQPNTDWQKTSVNGEGESYYYLRARVGSSFESPSTATQFAALPLYSNINSVPYSSTVNVLVEQDCSLGTCGNSFLSANIDAPNDQESVPTPTTPPLFPPEDNQSNPPAAAICGFTVSPANGPYVVGQALTFTSTSTPVEEIDSYFWTATSGSPLSSINSNYVWTPNQQGAHTITLMITGDFGSQSCPATINVVSPTPTPTLPPGVTATPTPTPKPFVPIIPKGGPVTGKGVN